MARYGDPLPTEGQIVVLDDGANTGTYALVLEHLDDHNDSRVCPRCGTPISYSPAGKDVVTGDVIHIGYDCRNP